MLLELYDYKCEIFYLIFPFLSQINLGVLARICRKFRDDKNIKELLQKCLDFLTKKLDIFYVGENMIYVDKSGILRLKENVVSEKSIEICKYDHLQSQKDGIITYRGSDFCLTDVLIRDGFRDLSEVIPSAFRDSFKKAGIKNWDLIYFEYCEDYRFYHNDKFYKLSGIHEIKEEDIFLYPPAYWSISNVRKNHEHNVFYNLDVLKKSPNFQKGKEKSSLIFPNDFGCCIEYVFINLESESQKNLRKEKLIEIAQERKKEQRNKNKKQSKKLQNQVKHETKKIQNLPKYRNKSKALKNHTPGHCACHHFTVKSPTTENDFKFYVKKDFISIVKTNSLYLFS